MLLAFREALQKQEPNAVKQMTFIENFIRKNTD